MPASIQTKWPNAGRWDSTIQRGYLTRVAAIELDPLIEFPLHGTREGVSLFRSRVHDDLAVQDDDSVPKTKVESLLILCGKSITGIILVGGIVALGKIDPMPAFDSRFSAI